MKKQTISVLLAAFLLAEGLSACGNTSGQTTNVNNEAGAAINTLLRYMVLFGGLSMAVLMILSVVLSGWVVKPMEKGYENERMSAIIRELLDLARLENTQIQIEDVDFGRIAMSAILPFEAKAFEKGIFLEYEIQEKLIAKGEKH